MILGLHKRPRSPSDSEGNSHKRMRDSEDSPSSQQQRLPQKIQRSKGRVAARDYEVAVQQLIKFSISSFCARLASEYAYPDRMTQVLWAKEAWKEGCASYEIEMAFNSEIIQIVRGLFLLFHLLISGFRLLVARHISPVR